MRNPSSLNARRTVRPIGADIQHRNVELIPAAKEMSHLPNDISGGRLTAQMHQDIHPIQESIQRVAEATGGRAIRRAGDLAAELDGIVEDGNATYLLSFSPQGQADGQFHQLTVKTAGKRRGLTLRYRTGYLYEKEPVTLKERFQRAVWRPADANEISVSTSVTAMRGGANVKLNIAASDLGLELVAGRWTDKIDIFFIQRDDAGVHARVEEETLELRLTPSTLQKLLRTGIPPFEHFAALQADTASLRVVVVDENSGHLGSVTIPSPVRGTGE